MRGGIHGYSGSLAAAIQDHRAALDIIPATDTHHHGAALQQFTLSLCLSPEPDHIDEAAAMLPRLRASYKGLRDAPLLRAKERWLEGSVYARQAEVKSGLSGLTRYGLRCKSAYHLRIAVKGLRRRQVHLEVEACTADLAAVEYHLDRTRLEDLLRDTTPDPELAGLWAAILSAVREPEPVFWAALEALRAATVERGCTPPLVPYGMATGW